MESVSSSAAMGVLPDSFQGVRDDIAGQIGLIWDKIKAPMIVPLLRAATFLCLIMSVMLCVEKVYMAVVIIAVKLSGRRPNRRYKWEPLRDDIELGNSAFPMVLVQIPMYNEKEVYKLSIGAACGLSWPSDRIIIQVLDDSTDPVIKDLVEMECQRWASKGINIKYEIRDNRSGYKAGALKEGMKHSYVKNCDFVAIFDADFQPDPDFMSRTIPFLVHNPELGLVQARWKFANSNECLMTRMQEMSLDYHFTVEQEVGSTLYAFFGFNGTAGVWRISALNEAGGWKDRTTVEDMDLAVRASLKGWKFLYLSDLKVKNELPSTFKAYRYQQHRWSCGPANLFRKMVMEIVRNKKVSPFKKVHVVYNFFFVRKIVAHIVTFVFYCVVIPATVLVPEVEIPKWGSVYIPSIITLLNAVGTPRFQIESRLSNDLSEVLTESKSPRLAMTPKKSDKSFPQVFLDHEFSASIMSESRLHLLRAQYKILSSVNMVLPGLIDRPNHFKPGRYAVWAEQLKAGMKLPFSEPLKAVCNAYNFIPWMLQPNSHTILIGAEAIFEDMGWPEIWRRSPTSL